MENKLEQPISKEQEEIEVLNDEEFAPLKDEHDEHYLRQGHNRSMPEDDGRMEYEEIVDNELSDDEFLREKEQKFIDNYKGTGKYIKRNKV